MCRRRFRSANSARLETTFLRRCSAKDLSTQERSTFVKVCNGGSSSRCRTRLDGRFPGRGSDESPSVRFAFSERMGKFSNRNPRRTSGSSFRRRETLLSSIPTVRARSLPVSTNLNSTSTRLDPRADSSFSFLLVQTASGTPPLTTPPSSTDPPPRINASSFESTSSSTSAPARSSPASLSTQLFGSNLEARLDQVFSPSDSLDQLDS